MGISLGYIYIYNMNIDNIYILYIIYIYQYLFNAKSESLAIKVCNWRSNSVKHYTGISPMEASNESQLLCIHLVVSQYGGPQSHSLDVYRSMRFPRWLPRFVYHSHQDIIMICGTL